VSTLDDFILCKVMLSILIVELNFNYNFNNIYNYIYMTIYMINIINVYMWLYYVYMYVITGAKKVDIQNAQIYELPEDGQKLRPKHGVIINQ
jgi:hypothetical protein